MTNTNIIPTLIKANTVVVSHKNCADGTMSAFLVWLAKGCPLDETVFNVHFYGHGDILPEINCQKLVVTDLAFSKDDLSKMGSVGSIVMIDHHKTAMSKFGHNCGEDTCVVGGKFLSTLVDMDKCGAMLTYEWFKPFIIDTLSKVYLKMDGTLGFSPYDTTEWSNNTRMDHMLFLINDRDMWLKKGGDATETQHMWFVETGNKYKNDWKSFFIRILDLVLDADDVYYNTMHLIQQRLDYKRSLVNTFDKKFQIVEFDGIKNVALCNNGGMFTSEVGELLYELDSEENEISFAMTYSIGRNEVFVGLRGKKPKQFDLSKLAAKYGGGGHPNASGFKMPVSEFFRLIQW